MYITNLELKSRLNKNLTKFITNEKYKIDNIKAIDLLTPERFDLLAKYIYIKFKDLKIESNFGKELYLEHIKAFNNFFENDESQKNGKAAFLYAFDDVINSISSNGINEDTIMPISDNTILDGAHRVATAIYFDKSIKKVDLEVEVPNYNYNFFKERGLSEVYLDYMATQYIELKENVYTIILWPSSGGGKEKELKSILDEYGSIIYRKEIKLKNSGPVHLVKQAYKTEDWLGSAKDGYIGAQNKAKWCFDKEGLVRVVLFESDKDMIEMKDKIRDLYKIKKHAIHINDTKEEALELAGLLFNKNSIHWMNHTSLKEFNWFSTLLNQYKSWIIGKPLNKEYYCIDGSSTLAVYAIREARDLDYIYFGEEIDTSGFKEIDCHNDELIYHTVNRDSILFNPNNYFKIDNFKFISLNLIKDMKLNRNEEKDKLDVKMIDAVLDNKKLDIDFKEYFRVFTQPSYWKAKIKFILLKIRFYLTKLLRGLK